MEGFIVFSIICVTFVVAHFVTRRRVFVYPRQHDDLVGEDGNVTY